jgi:hypothetical protein
LIPKERSFDGNEGKTTSMTNWRRSAKSVRPKATWIEGNGEYASISDCPPGTKPVRNPRDCGAGQIGNRLLRVRRFMPREAGAQYCSFERQSGMNAAYLTDTELHRLARRRLQDRPSDPAAWQASIAELLALAAPTSPREWSSANQCRPVAPASAAGWCRRFNRYVADSIRTMIRRFTGSSSRRPT